MLWMEKDFEPQTREKANGEPRGLFMDGHSSHYSSELLEFCIAHNIEIFGYPPHCTHALQGLDVVCFSKHKEEWKREIDMFQAKNFRGVNKDDFVEVFGKAYLRAFTRELVEAAWSATGLIPFNRDVIRPEQMKPAEVTSTKSTFPLPQNSPTRAVMTAFRNHNFTYHDVHPDSPPLTGPSTFPGSLNSPVPSLTPSRNLFPTTHSSLHPSPQTSPSKRPAVDPASDPSLMTPSKRMRFLGNGLASTASASFLVTSAKPTHTQMSQLIKPPVIESIPETLPSPDWSVMKTAIPLGEMSKESLIEHSGALSEELRKACDIIRTQNSVIEGQNAQLIVQNMGMEQMNESLHAKENTKKTDRTVLFPGGKGRHLTGSEFRALKKKQEEAKIAQKSRMESRKADRWKKRVEKVKVELAWKRIQQEHAKSVEDWKGECQQLRNGGSRIKDLPKGPGRCRLKSTVTLDDYRESDGVVEDVEDDESGGEDDNSGSDA